MQTIEEHPAFHPFIADGRKTMTRRVIDIPKGRYWRIEDGVLWITPSNPAESESVFAYEAKPKLRIGEIFRFEGVDIDLRCTAIKCERLQEISEGDAVKEGVEECSGIGRVPRTYFLNPIASFYEHCQEPNMSPCPIFRQVWHEIYPTGPKSWEANPVVWAIEFEKQGAE